MMPRRSTDFLASTCAMLVDKVRVFARKLRCFVRAARILCWELPFISEVEGVLPLQPESDNVKHLSSKRWGAGDAL
jgi:hypothetical protein